jgi:HD-GYP domain-containing protein (c-di-GMP phosphodiesterase class II)
MEEPTILPKPPLPPGGENKLAELSAFYEISSIPTSLVDLTDIFDLVLDKASRLLGTEIAIVYVLDEERGELVPEAVRGIQKDKVGCIERGEGAFGRVIKEGKVIVLSREREELMAADPLTARYPIKEAIYVPIRTRARSRVAGLIYAARLSEWAFTTQEVSLFTILADRAGIAIETAQLFAQLEGTMAELQRSNRELREMEVAMLNMMEDLQKINEELRALNQVSQELSKTIELPVLLDLAVGGLAGLVNATHCFLLLLSEGKEELYAVATWGEGKEAFQGQRFPLAQGQSGSNDFPILAQTVRERKPIVVDDVHTSPFTPDKEWMARWGIKSFFSLPLLVKDESSGAVILAEKRYPRHFTADEVNRAMTVANQAAIAIENARLFEAEQRRRQELEGLQATTASITAMLDLESLLQTIVKQGVELFNAPAASLMMWDEREENLTIRASWGLSDEYVQKQRIPRERVYAAATPEGEFPPVLTPDVRQAPFGRLDLVEKEHLCTVLSAPLVKSGQSVGVLNIYSQDEPREFTPPEIKLAETLADQAAIAIENARLYEETQRELAERERAEGELQHTLAKLREALGGIIQTVALTVETRDPHTAGHQRRVANLARAIADEMGLSEKQVDGIRMAGLIHDLGKISVPVEILSKPGRLSELEWGMIQAHPQVGYDVLKTVDFPWPVAQIVLQHHERMDGSGYPQGLSGEEIMLEARILGVADVVEAMASHRPYRPPRGLDKALEEISQNRGVLYDPEVVDACLTLFTEKGFTFE